MSPLGGFDQVVAITQKHINDNLIARYKLYKSLQAFTPKVEDEEDGSMQGTMDPPTVELVIPGEPRKARFLLHFKKGSTFNFRAKLDGDDKKTMHTLPMDGWTLAFIANLAPRSLQNVPDEMRSVISEDICQKIEAAGSYSLQQIIIDVGTSDVLNFDLAHSVTPGLNPANGKDIKQKKVLSDFLYLYLQELSNGNHNVLGYAVTIEEVALKPEDKPSLPPVLVKLQTMPYEAAANPAIATSNERDAFLFCEMIGDTTGRSAPANALEGAYAWCQPPNFGTMLISRASVWDRYFRDKICFLNSESIFLLNQVGVWAQSEGKKGGTPGEVPAWDLTVGDFPFPEGTPPPSWTSTTDTSAHYEWKGSKEIKPPRKWDGPSISYTTTSSSTVDVKIDLAANRFVVEGKLSYHYEDAFSHSTNYGFTSQQIHNTAEVQWILKLAFNSAGAGHLGFDEPVIEVPECTCKKWRDQQGLFEMIFGGQFINQQLGELMTKVIKDRIASSKLVDHVRDGLKQQAGFVFPGGQTFKMKDPTFTHDGDLTVGLMYMGNKK
jgi:hypothetical protein